MDFTTEQIESIEKLAGLNYTIKQIALYLDIDPTILYREYVDKNSVFRYRFDRGRLIAQADVDQKLLTNAKNGNLTAMQQFEKIRIARHFENMRDQMINGD